MRPGKFRHRLHKSRERPGVQHDLREQEIIAVRKILPELGKDLWPLARQVQKKWTAWLGPTNSGKTHEALVRLKRSRGSYLAPLRLLAQEVQERLESDGVPTNLLTGEERIYREKATHVSATVEMGSTTQGVHCVVVDEVQMLSDRERGHAWVRAILGSPAEELLLCGSPSSEKALQKLADYAKIPLEIHWTERKNPLSLAPDPIPLSKVPDGSIVVAFTRLDVLDLSRFFRDRGRSFATIYGAMPPELRRAESKRFRTGEASVLLATDAVGMGLNIPANHVIFTATTKFDGRIDRPLFPEEIQQIGGRAGRFGLHREGVVAGIDRSTHSRVRRFLRESPVPVSGPFPFMPDFPIVQAASKVLGSGNLEVLLSRLHASIQTDAFLRSGIGPECRQKAARLELLCPGLPLEERWMMLFSPLNRVTENDFWRWVVQAGRSHGCSGRSLVQCPPIREIYGRKEGEETLARLSLYRWLALRFPHRFPEFDVAVMRYGRVLEETRLILEREGRVRRKGKKSKRAGWEQESFVVKENASLY